MNWLISPWRLRKLGVLGMNQRNIEYISGHNERRLFPLVDDKLKTKELAIAAGLTVPQLVGVINYQHQVRTIGELLHTQEAFCIKPSKGSGSEAWWDGVQERTEEREIIKRLISDVEADIQDIELGLSFLPRKEEVLLRVDSLLNAPDASPKAESWSGENSVVVVIVVPTSGSRRRVTSSSPPVFAVAL